MNLELQVLMIERICSQLDIDTTVIMVHGI